MTSRRVDEGPAVTVRRAKRLAPETFLRVRAACEHAAAGIDLDEYVATVVLTVVAARKNRPRPLAFTGNATSA